MTKETHQKEEENTMTTQHTPGLWKLSKHATPDYAPQYGVHADKEDFVIIKGENAEANARLIVAAPELLECVKQLAWFIENVSDDTPNKTELFFAARETWRKAITKPTQP